MCIYIYYVYIYIFIVYIYTHIVYTVIDRTRALFDDLGHQPATRSYLCWLQSFRRGSHRQSVSAQFPDLLDGHLCRTSRRFPHGLARKILSGSVQSRFRL